jgi:hypothetical protein
MLLLTLEGLPHSGRAAVLRIIHRDRPAWIMVNVPHHPASPWHSLARKVQAVSANAKADILVLNVPWFEHVPAHPATTRLQRAMTRELVEVHGCHVDTHVMVHLRMPHDESFEQMVCSGNSCYNTTTLEDLRNEQVRIAQELLDTPKNHPFECATFALPCPPFFDDCEATLELAAHDVVRIVETLKDADSL